MTEEIQASQNIQADNNSIAVGSVSVGGSIDGSLIIGSHNVVGFTSDQVSTLITQISTTFQVKPFDGRCPYKGLETFNEEDSELFFGREGWVENLMGRVKESRTLFITGQSGSGKSSLVRAGLIPTLKKSGYSEHWLYATLKPGRDPIDALGNAFSRLKDPSLGKYLRENAAQASVLHECAESVLSERTDQRLVLYLDQFEEVFTQLSKDKAQIFINLLAHAATVENGRVIILFSMRSDFVPNCATYPQLNDLLNQQFVQIGAMQPEELVSAIAQPALRVGLKIDPDLIAQIINDMKGEPGALPLMQFALKDLFDAEQAKGGMIALTLSDYLEHGGINQALERHANASLEQLTDTEKELARSVFSGLIEIGRGTQDTRRTALSNELIPAGAHAEAVKAVVQKLASARLITTDATTVTISHEKLIDAWPWLKKLVNENRDVIAMQNEIAADAKEWEEHKRDASYLYSGARLINAREQLKAHKLTLSGTASDFVQAGFARQQREQRARIFSIAGVVALIIAGIAFFSYVSTTNANKLAEQSENSANTQMVIANTAQAASTLAIANEEEAKRQATISHSQVLAVNSQLNIDKLSHNLLLGIESFNLVKDYSYVDRTIAQQALRDTLTQVGGLPFSGHESSIRTLAFSPDGAWLATGAEDATARLWNLHDPAADPIVLRGHENTIISLAFSPDGTWLATGSWDATARLWNIRDPAADPIVLRGHEDSIYTLAFSPDGAWLATGADDATARLWNLNNPAANPIVLRGHEGPIYTLAFSPDGAWLATESWDATTRLWNLRDPAADPIVLRGPEGGINTPAFSPDGAWLATSSHKTALLWNLDTDDWLQTACQVVGRNFTRVEWGKYFPNEDYRKTCEQWPLEPEVTATPTVSP